MCGGASQPCCLRQPLWPNSRLQRDLTKLDNPKGRVPTWPCLPGPAPTLTPIPSSLSVSVSLFSSVFLSLYGLCFLVFHSDKCNMMGKRHPDAQEGKLGKPGKETPHPHLPHLSVGFFAVLKCETLSKPPTAPTLSPTSLPSSSGWKGGRRRKTTTITTTKIHLCF